MSRAIKLSSVEDTHYVGLELNLFQHAVRWKSYLAQTLQPFIHGNVLEVGAGIGGTTRILHTGREDSWTCLEPDSMLAHRLEADLLHEDNQRSRHNITVVQGKLSDLPRGLLFDSILYIDVLEHIQDDKAELRNAFSLAKDGGYLVVVAPAYNFLYTAFDRAIGHYRRYDRRSLKSLTPEGARLVMINYIDSVGLAASFMNKLFLKSSMPTLRQIRIWDRLIIPCSKVIDPLVGNRMGKSILAVWKRDRHCHS
jgi:SAM-dependent methyltransferase